MVNVGIISVGFEKFKLSIAQQYLDKTISDLSKENVKLYDYPVVINSKDQLNEAKSTIFKNVDMMIIQVGTFAMGEMILEIVEATKDIPLFIWGFKDPIVDDFNTIPLNSLTGLNMLTSYLKRYDKIFSYTYESFGSEAATTKLMVMIEAIRVKKDLQQSKFAIIGTRAPGFYLSEVNHVVFKKNVGPTLEYYSIGELAKRSELFEQDIVDKTTIEKFGHVELKGLKSHLNKTVRVYLAIKELIIRENITALTIKCWPEWQSLIGIAVCPVLSLLNDEGYMTSCEGDINGLATMYMQYLLTKQAPFFCDLATATENRVKAWHCGHMPMSLSDGPISLTEHPTMKDGIGLAIQADMIVSDRITMAKLSELNNEFRLFIATGKSVKPDRKLDGPQTDMVLDTSIEATLDLIFNEGIEHHYSVSYHDIEMQLKELSKWMGWKVIQV